MQNWVKIEIDIGIAELNLTDGSIKTAEQVAPKNRFIRFLRWLIVFASSSNPRKFNASIISRAVLIRSNFVAKLNWISVIRWTLLNCHAIVSAHIKFVTNGMGVHYLNWNNYRLAQLSLRSLSNFHSYRFPEYIKITNWDNPWWQYNVGDCVRAVKYNRIPTKQQMIKSWKRLKVLVAAPFVNRKQTTCIFNQYFEFK